MQTVIFACVHNAGRSQMAAAWLQAHADQTRIRALSAGTAPADRVHPEVVQVMREVGIELAGKQPQKLDAALLQKATHLVTMGCGEDCPPLPASVARLDWPFEDPKGKSIEHVRRIRDAIRDRVLLLLDEWRAAEAR
ncbi:MAG: arsenate reductase ArsC [Planctomycetota bacterium]